MVSLEQKTLNEHFTPSFWQADPARRSGPFIFSSPHSGRLYPDSFANASRLSARRLRSSEDAYVDELFAHVVDQGCHFIKALAPRAFLDLNRHPYELDPKLFGHALPAYAMSDTVKVKSGLGIIARIVSEGCEIYQYPPSLDDALRRINHLYFPWHQALGSLIETIKKDAGCALLFDCHSMPSTNIPGFTSSPPDFVLGNQFDKSCDYELTHLVRAKLQAMGYHVSVNKPYAGGYVTKQYGRPANGVHVLQIEINRRLYLDEHRIEKTAGFEPLRENMVRLTQEIVEARPDLSFAPPLAAE